MTAARRAGRKRKPVAVSLPPIASLPAEQRPRAARARLEAVSRPLQFDARHEAGEVVLSQRLPPRMRPDDRLTPERRRHAEAAELLVVMDVFTTDAGERTQLKRQRLVSPLEQLWKAGVLDPDLYGAARRFQRDVDMAAVTGPGQTVSYQPRMIDGGATRFLSPIEEATDIQRKIQAAREACGPTLAWMLDWLAIEPCGWRQAAKERFPGASERFARVEFKRMLRLACASLETHYRRR